MRFTHGTWTGMVYVAFILDLFSRRIIGWRAGLLDNHVYGLRQSSSGCLRCVALRERLWIGSGAQRVTAGEFEGLGG